jgi:threonine dehydratase
VVMPAFVSKVKQQATIGYGAELILTDTRQQAEALAEQKAAEGAFLLPPSADARVIAGQGTACLEALQDGDTPDAIFAACGGGGLLSGSWLAAQLLAPRAQIFGAEPRLGNDATRSCQQGQIVSLYDTPMTIADGARTLHISDITFHYLRKLTGFCEVEEEEIMYWTQWLQHLLKVTVEPTAAMAMAAAFQWLKTQDRKQRVLVILSGGNVDAATYQQVWKRNYLEHPPVL